MDTLKPKVKGKIQRMIMDTLANKSKVTGTYYYSVAELNNIFCCHEKAIYRALINLMNKGLVCRKTVSYNKYLSQWHHAYCLIENADVNELINKPEDRRYSRAKKTISKIAKSGLLLKKEQ